MLQIETKSEDGMPMSRSVTSRTEIPLYLLQIETEESIPVFNLNL